MAPVRIVNWLSLAFLALVAFGTLLFLAVGTVFFDDPNANYGDFVVWATTPLLLAALAAGIGRAGSRWLERTGHPGPAILVAALPAPVTIAGLAYLLG